VIVPQLGGFVLQVVPASYVEEEHLFRPMHKEVVFNAKLRHNDGLLSERYMEAYKVTFQRASRMVDEDVAEIQALIRKGIKVALGAVGSLSLEKEGQIVFHTGDVEAFSVDSYGLTSFQLKTWHALQLESHPLTVKEKRNTFYIPINRRVLRGVASAAAAIALFLIVSTPVKEVNQSAYTASFVPVGIVSKISTPAPETTTLPDVTVSVTTSKETDATPVTAKPKLKPVTAREAEAQFYVVIASVSSKQQASDFIAYNVDFSVMKNANVMLGGGKIRVYAEKFSDRNKADAYLARLRQNPQFYDAWMYTKEK
jgi:cell division septation protein DedD